MPSNHNEGLHFFQEFAKFGIHCLETVYVTIRLGLVAGTHIWKGNNNDGLIKNLGIADYKSLFLAFYHWDFVNNLVDFIDLQNAIVLNSNR